MFAQNHMAMQRIFFGQASNTWVQLLRYTLVGGIAFAVDFSTLVLLTELMGIHYLVSAAAGFATGLATNYGLSVSWVFNRHRLSSRRLEFALFGTIGLVGLGLNELFIYAFTEWAGIHYIYSKFLTTVLVYLWNFGARKVVLFR